MCIGGTDRHRACFVVCAQQKIVINNVCNDIILNRINLSEDEQNTAIKSMFGLHLF